MLLLLQLIPIVSLASALALEKRQSDQNIPYDEPYCRCIDKTQNSDETLTQAICRGPQHQGTFAVYESTNPTDPFQGACFSYNFSLDSVDDWDKACKAQSGNQCKYFARCVDEEGNTGEGAPTC
ncbi:hypothetical protein AC578_6125 [Pseudocercospora eumusae]|uniref:Uncharacterized protein n=1 Tax=Pseudocercospora eumusae TaxID=321146 RepID=A0A139GXM3_9PEZI|nr:hypothetical protein AC578_6125 [Pseudocercospora eumusae]